MKLIPHEWQLEDQRKLRANNYTGLVAIEAGGGKSLTATLAIRDAKPDVTLIIAPKSTHRTAWEPTVQDNADRELRIMGATKKAEKQAFADFLLGYPGVYITSPQWATRLDLSDWAGDMLIHDESHQGSTMGSKIQRKLSGYHMKDGEPLARRFDARLALSGTPMRQQFENLWATMRFLWGAELFMRGDVAADNPFSWMADRMDYEDVVTGFEWKLVEPWMNLPSDTKYKRVDGRLHFGKVKTVKKYLTETTPGRLLSEMPCVVMHKRRETCCEWHKPVELPDGTMTPGGFLTVAEPQIIKRTLELTPAQRKSIKQMETTMMAELEGQFLVADISLTQKQRIRQMTLAEAHVRITEEDKSTIEFAPDCKSPFLDEVFHILSNLPEDEPVIVYVESRRFAAITVQRLNEAGIPTAEYSGVKKADLNEFGKSYRVLVGVVSSIGTGTAGLNHVAHTEIVLEQPVSLTLKSQTEARLERLDNTVSVQRYVLLDDMGVQEGRFEENVVKQTLINRSLRKVVS